MSLKLVSLALTLSATAALAALPPLNDHQRESTATDIFEGEVLHVDRTLEPVSGREQDKHFKDWHSKATIEVSRWLKSSRQHSATPSEITVTYRKTARRPTGWTGPQGQNDDLYEHTQVKLYTSEISDDEDTFKLLEPNGWEYLPNDSDMMFKLGEDEPDDI